MRLSLFLCLLSVASITTAQDQQTLEWYYQRAGSAIESENYEAAVRIIEEGKQRYPQAARLNLLLADLYYDKELYQLALEEYQSADEKEGEDYLTMVQISRCHGKLNQERDSIRMLERILELYPESVSSIDDLGWMYFKTHQLEKGEELLLDALKLFGPDRGIYMTLGTLYSGLYDYENSKRFYLKAIEDALAEEDTYFASVAYYNLSLLEHSFYHFNSALRYTEESIASADRAPGHLARGELFQSRLDFTMALSEYQQAAVKDTTPLAKVNLAMLYQIFGMLEPARRHAEEVLGSQDLAWMYYYGTDMENHLKDVHEILGDVYQGLARTEKSTPKAGLVETIWSGLRALKYRLIAYYHRQKFRLYSLKVGRSYLQEKNYLDAYWEFYRGNERYRWVAVKYLHLARDLEMQVCLHAEIHYRQEEGKLGRNRQLLESSLADLDPFWEKEGLYESLRCLAPLLKRGSVERRQALNRLYGLNPGGFLQNGFGLPLSVEIRREGSLPSRTLGQIRRYLRRAGSELTGPGGQTAAAAQGFRYHLSLLVRADGSLRVELLDRERQRVVFVEPVQMEAGSPRRQAAAAARRILEKIYAVR